LGFLYIVSIANNFSHKIKIFISFQFQVGILILAHLAGHKPICPETNAVFICWAHEHLGLRKL